MTGSNIGMLVLSVPPDPDHIQKITYYTRMEGPKIMSNMFHKPPGPINMY
jgi:hypothetical protein